MKERYGIFHQSLNDFPCMVELGKKAPSWGINRWRDGLRFIPPDDECFSLRGNRRYLLYKGKQRSHRFNILNDKSFEYDCILNKEPDSNVVILRMEGAEKFDFFRQPDFVSDPFLKGSYAVYKKVILIGEGTGKLCHIHRPQIIDTRGRKCWGELSIAGNELRITIPEQWLSEAKYPVVVDPVVGTTTVGSLNEWVYDEGENACPLWHDCTIPVNRFYVPETINGQCTAYFYADEDDKYAGGRPVFYSDSANKPHTRRSKDETLIDLRVISGKPAGWRSAKISSNASIPGGSYIWFGMYAEYEWLTRFDLGVLSYNNPWANEGIIPNTYPHYSYVDADDFKLSMYFTYTANFTRTLTQGINLTDARKLTSEYKRVTPQTAGIEDKQKLAGEYKRQLFLNIKCSDNFNALLSIFRQCIMTVTSSLSFFRLSDLLRFIADNSETTGEINHSREINRFFYDTVLFSDEAKIFQRFYRWITENVINTDHSGYNVLFVHTAHETQTVTDTFSKIDNYFRGLYMEACSLAETVRWGDYFRIKSDTVQAESNVFRHLFIFIKLASVSFVRDFVIRRFLIAREQLILKSCITRELILESKIN